jgi:recombination protein RecA
LNFAVSRCGRGMRSGNSIELAGEPGTGKTLIALKLIASAQSQGGYGFFIDVEGRLDFEFAQSLGVNLEDLYYYKPTKEVEVDTVLRKVPLTQDEVFTIVRSILQQMDEEENKEIPFVICLDSLGALLTERDLGLETSGKGYKTREDGTPKSDQGMRAKDLRPWVGAVSPLIQESQGLFIILNHLFSNTSGYGKAVDTRGGRAPKHLASARIFFSKGAPGTRVTDVHNDVVGEVINAFVEKNSVGPPYRTAELLVKFKEEGGVALDYFFGAVSHFIKVGMVVRSGAWYQVVGSTFKVQGEQKIVDALNDETLVIENGILKVVEDGIKT